MSYNPPDQGHVQPVYGHDGRADQSMPQPIYTITRNEHIQNQPVYTSTGLEGNIITTQHAVSYLPLQPAQTGLQQGTQTIEPVEIMPQNVMFSSNLGMSYPQTNAAVSTITSGPSCQVNAERPKPQIMILEKMKQLRDEGKYCDLFIDVKGMRFLAHKSLIAAWSPYFDEALTSTNYVDKNLLVIQYDSYEVFSDLLEFLYTGNIAPRETNFLQLLHLAVSFKIDLLKSYCEEFLRCNLHLGNFLTTYFLSRKYSLDELEEYLVGFLSSNLSDAVKQSEFLQMKPEKIHALLSKGGMLKLKQEMKLFLVISWVSFDVQTREKYLVLLLKHIDWSAVASDFLLEISRTENFFTTHESSLYLLLQTLDSSGICLGPYCHTFTALRQTYSHLLTEVVKHGVIIAEQDEFVPVRAVGATTKTIKYDAFTSTESLQASTQIQRPWKQTEKVQEKEQSQQEQAYEDDFHVGESDFVHISQNEDYIEEKSNCDLEEVENTESTENSQNIEELDESEKLQEEPTHTMKTRGRGLRKSKTSPKKDNDRPLPTEFFLDCSTDGSNVNDSKENLPVNEDNMNNSSNNAGTGYQNEKGDYEDFEGDEDDFYDEEDEEYEEEKETPKKTKTKRRKRNSAVDKTDGGEKMDCQHCSYSTNIKRRFEKHIKWNHENGILLKCTFCNQFESQSNRRYMEHMRSHFSGPPWHCEVSGCDYFSEKFPLLVAHRMKHFEDRPFSCDVCGVRFRTMNNVYAHKKTHEGKRPFKCPHCDKSFAMKNTLDQHLVTHDNLRPYLCDLCGFSTKYQSHLTSHRRIHTGDLFKCDHPNCNYQTPKKSQLKCHMRIHLNIRSYSCADCGKTFLEKSHLSRHRTIHLPDKPFKCNFCDYSTNRKDKLKYHVSNSHDNAGDKIKRPKGRPSKAKKPIEKPEVLPDAIYVHRVSGKNLDHTGYTIQTITPEPGETLTLEQIRRSQFGSTNNLDGITIQVPVSTINIDSIISADDQTISSSPHPLPATSPVTPVTLIPEDHQMYIQNVMTQVSMSSAQPQEQSQQQTTQGQGQDYGTFNALIAMLSNNS